MGLISPSRLAIITVAVTLLISILLTSLIPTKYYPALVNAYKYHDCISRKTILECELYSKFLKEK